MQTREHLADFIMEFIGQVTPLQFLNLQQPAGQGSQSFRLIAYFGVRPLPLVPRARVAGVRERLRADGSLDTPLDEASVREGVGRLTAQNVEGLVVSLLHSYRNAAHERQTRSLAERAAPGLPVSISSDVWPQAREYERTAHGPKFPAPKP